MIRQIDAFIIYTVDYCKMVYGLWVNTCSIVSRADKTRMN